MGLAVRLESQEKEPPALEKAQLALASGPLERRSGALAELRLVLLGPLALPELRLVPLVESAALLQARLVREATALAMAVAVSRTSSPTASRNILPARASRRSKVHRGRKLAVSSRILPPLERRLTGNSSPQHRGTPQMAA